MPTKIERYMHHLLKETTPYSGFLGAYNMGVWGVSVSGQRSIEQGLLVSGKVLGRRPRTAKSGPVAQNYVKYYDTPNLWGYGDPDDQRMQNAVGHARGVLGISGNRVLSKDDKDRIGSYLKSHYNIDWNDTIGKTWQQLAKTSSIQMEMDRIGAWTNLVDRWRAVISQSKFLVDVTSLSPPLDRSEVQVAICAGIVDCLRAWAVEAKQNPNQAPFLMIRLMFGMTATDMGSMNYTHWNEFKAHVQNACREVRNEVRSTGAAQLPVVVYGSDMGKMISTFNHSKIVAGDGQYALVGGHNMCEEVSSNRAPCIHDITCEVTGPGAGSANAFAGSLWLKAAESGRLYIHRFDWQKNAFEDLSHEATKKWAPNNKWYYELGAQKEVPKVLANQYWYYPMQDLPTKPEYPPPAGSAPATAIMGIGRWGDTTVFSVNCTGGLQLNTNIPLEHACQYASDYLKRLMINDRRHTMIAMSQQDMVNAGPFGGAQKSKHTICEIIGKRLRKTPKGTAIRIVVSSRYTQNCEGLAYSYGDGPREAVERISDSIKDVSQASSSVKKLPPRLAALSLTSTLGADAPFYVIDSPDDSSFCTVAPLTFCEARGTTRDRGSYVWPEAKYQNTWGATFYASSRFWNSNDKAELKFGPGNHAKVMFVCEGNDDATGLVMIGSDNMYPSPLSEFNFVIEGAAAIKLFREQYWDRLWGYSARLGFTVAPNGDVV